MSPPQEPQDFEPVAGEILEARLGTPQIVVAVCMVVQTIALIVIALALL